MANYRWLLFALLGAVFAAVVNVITKPALKQLDVGIAMIVQGACMVGVFLILTTVMGNWSKFAEAPASGLALMAIAGAAAGLAWYFGYMGLKLSSVAQSTPIDRMSLLIAVVLAMIFLGERPSGLNWAGIVLMLVGAVFVAQTSTK